MTKLKSHSALYLRLLSGGLWNVIGRITAVGAGFMVNAFIARLVSAEEVGAYFLLISVVSAGSLFAALGMPVAVVRLVAQAMAQKTFGVARKTVTKALRVTFVSTAITALLLGLGGDVIGLGIFHSPTMANVMWLGAAQLMLLVLLNVLAESFRGFHDVRLATIFGNNTSTTLLMMLFLAVAVRSNEAVGLSYILTNLILAGAISVLFAALLMQRRLARLDTSANIPTRSILELGLPMMVSSVAIFLLTQADLWILGMFSSAEDVAVYGAATRLAVLIYMPLLISNTMLAPFISEMYSQGKVAQLETVIRVTASLSALPAVVMLFVFIFAGESILTLAYGDYYSKAHLLLILIGIGQCVNVLSGSGMTTLLNTGHQKAVMNISIVFGGLIVIGAFAMVGRYGVFGVALVSGSMFAAQALFTLIWVKRQTGMWTSADPRHLLLGLARLSQVFSRA